MIYDKYKELKIWNVIKEVLQELEKNNDIEITTHQDIVIGYIIKVLKEKKY